MSDEMTVSKIEFGPLESALDAASRKMKPYLEKTSADYQAEVEQLKGQNAELLEECASWRSDLRKEQVKCVELEKEKHALAGERHKYRRLLLDFAHLVNESMIADARIDTEYERGWNEATKAIRGAMLAMWEGKRNER